MPPLSSTVSPQMVATSTNCNSTTEIMGDPCDKVDDEYIEKSASEVASSTTKEQVEVKIVWKNVILFSLLHLASLYAIYLMFTSAQWKTNIFG